MIMRKNEKWERTRHERYSATIVSIDAAEEHRKLMNEKMDQKKKAVENANQYVREWFVSALNHFQGNDSKKQRIIQAIEGVCRSKSYPYGKIQQIVNILEEEGVEIDSGYWQIIVLNCRKKVSDMTNPNQFYDQD